MSTICSLGKQHKWKIAISVMLISVLLVAFHSPVRTFFGKYLCSTVPSSGSSDDAPLTQENWNLSTEFATNLSNSKAGQKTEHGTCNMTTSSTNATSG
uniref:Uncharacterized protein n=1 Tax=Arundo donax TaxID=35708 RepID=A0A0A9FM83_ARUDO